jgi:hypothetical protein
MNSDTVNNPDATRSRLGPATGEPRDLYSNPNHTRSQRRDEQISAGARHGEESERRNDATSDVKLSANRSWGAMEEEDATKVR